MDPPTMAKYAIKNGARVSGGTDMNKLAKAICQDYDLTAKTTNDEKELLEHLKAGGMAIANVGGDRKGWTGVFSDSGHFVVVAAATGNTVSVMDPSFYRTKFNKAGRRGKVTVSGNYCNCGISVLAADTANRTPSYYLFSKKEVADMKIKEFKDVPVVVKGKAIPGALINGETWVPIRKVAEPLGGKVTPKDGKVYVE